MTDLRDVIKLRKRYEDRFAQEIVVTNGEIVARSGSTKVPGVPNHYWVIPLGEGEPVAVYNRNVKATRPGLAVQIGYAPNSTVLEILRTVIDANSQSEDTGGINLEPHAGSHRVDGDDPLFIETRAITSLLTYPTGQSGLSVHVSSYTYVGSDGITFVVFAGQHFLDLSGYKPLAGSLLALIYLDRTTNTLAVAVGATIPQDSRAFIPPAPDLPDNAIPSAFVRLGASATTLGWPDFIEARDFLGGGAGGGNAWPTAGQNLLGTTNYDSVGLLAAAMAVGDIGYLGPRHSDEAVVHNVNDGTLRGVDPDAVVFTSSLVFGADYGTYRPKLVGVQVYTADEGAAVLINGSEVDLIDVKVFHSEVDDAKGFHFDGSGDYCRLINCEAMTNGAVSSHGVHASGTGTVVRVHGGTFFAMGVGNRAFYADTGATIELYGPRIDGASFGGPGTVRGYYFDSEGLNFVYDNSGLQGKCWRLRADGLQVPEETILNALDNASAGDTILIYPGTVNMAGGAITIDKAVTVRGIDPKTCIITNSKSNDTCIIVTADNVRIEGLTINHTGTGTGGSAIRWATNNLVIKDCFLNCTGAANTNYILDHQGGNTTASRIENCVMAATGGTVANYGYANTTAPAKADIIGGAIVAGTGEIFSNQASSTTQLAGVRLLSSAVVSHSGTRRGNYLNSTGQLLSLSSIFTAANTDVFPDGMSRGTARRIADHMFSSRVTHFPNGAIPSGFGWASYGSMITPPNISQADDYIGLAFNAANKGFLNKAVTSGASNWQNKASWGRFTTGLVTEIGLRVDDGTDNNYAELYVTGTLSNATIRVDFRYRSGGGAVTTVTSGLIVPAGQFISLYLLCYWSGTQYFFYGYILGEHGSAVNISGFNTPAITWPGSAGNWGIFAANAGNHGFCDLFGGTYT